MGDGTGKDISKYVDKHAVEDKESYIDKNLDKDLDKGDGEDLYLYF